MLALVAKQNLAHATMASHALAPLALHQHLRLLLAADAKAANVATYLNGASGLKVDYFLASAKILKYLTRSDRFTLVRPILFFLYLLALRNELFF